MSIALHLCELGHVASRQRLLRTGATPRELRDAVHFGSIDRVARGVYACLHLDNDSASATAAGALIDCVSALGRHEVWSGIHPHTLHVRADPHQHLGRLPAGAVAHWSRKWKPTESTEVSGVDALLQAMRCLTPSDWLAAAESALYCGYVDGSDWQEVVRLAPEWIRPTIALLDRGAQSGLETHTRSRLVHAGHGVRTQVPIPGTSPLDMLVDECVGVETDGKKWHGDRFLHDRTKDIVIEGHGIRVLRIASSHVFDEWPRTLATIERMIADSPRTQLRRSRRE